MVSTAIAYAVLTIALVGLLVFTSAAGNLLLTAQSIPSAYIELGSISYLAIEEMVSVYRASSMTRTAVSASVNVPESIVGSEYSLTVRGDSLIAVTSNLNRTFTLPNLPNTVWVGSFSSGGLLLHITGEYESGTALISISS